MAVSFPVEDALAALRTVMLSAWEMTEGTDPILMTGDDPIRGDDFPDELVPIPLGIIQLIQEAPVSSTASARSRVLTLPFRLWLVMKKEAGVRSIDTLMGRLLALQEALYDDQHLTNTAMTLEVTGIDWSGTGVNAPVSLPDPSSGVLAGYVGVEIELAGVY